MLNTISNHTSALETDDIILEQAAHIKEPLAIGNRKAEKLQSRHDYFLPFFPSISFFTTLLGWMTKAIQ